MVTDRSMINAKTEGDKIESQSEAQAQAEISKNNQIPDKKQRSKCLSCMII